MRISLSGRLWHKTIWRGLLSVALASSATSANCQDAPAQNLAGKITDLVDEVVTPEVELQVPVRRSKILRMKQDIFRTAIADPSILDFVAFGTREVELIGKRSGTTTVTFWVGTEQAPELLSMLVTVVHDAESEDGDRNEISRFARKINELFPNSRIQLILIGNKLIARGQAHDEAEAAKIQALLSNSSGGGGGGGGSSNGSFSNARTGLVIPDRPDLQNVQLVNLIQIPGAKQVMLKVRIAELRRSAIREIGTDFEIKFKEWMLSSALAGGGNIMATGMFNDADLDLMIKALESNGSARVLAEPNLVTISGQSATFIAGGEFAVPTVVGVGGAQAATTTFKSIGTQLDFTPTVLDHDRIRLNVAPSFTEVDDNLTVDNIPGTVLRSVQTTVEMREGQSLAIAGLLQDQSGGADSRLPVIGRIPGLNFITGSRKTSRIETELLIVITPELVEPMDAGQAPTLLPGMEVTEPNDLDFYIFGDIEGRPNCHHRSTVWPLYKSRLDRCYKNNADKRSTGFFLNGLHGFSK